MDISYIFAYCRKILSLPDKSKWKTDNIIDISGAFSDCFLYLSLPEI